MNACLRQCIVSVTTLVRVRCSTYLLSALVPSCTYFHGTRVSAAHLAIVDVAQLHHLPRIHLTPFTECLSIPLDLRVLSTRCCVHFLLQLGVQHQRKPKRSLGVCHDCPLQFRCRHYQGCRQQRHAAINLGTTFLAAAASVDDYGRRIDSPSCRSLSRRLWPTH